MAGPGGSGKGGGGKNAPGATKESLAITQQMSVLINQMAASSDRIARSFESQAAATAEMSENMKGMGTGEVVNQLVQVNATLKEVAASLASLNQTSAATFAAISEGALLAASSTDKLSDASKKAAEAAAKETTSLQDLQEKLGRTGKNAMSARDKIKAVGEYLEKDFPVATGAALGALSGLQQGFSNLTSLGSGILGFASSIGSALFDIGKSIISIPFKLFDGLINMAKKGGGISELATALNNIRKEFGALSGPVASSIQSTAREMKGFTGAGVSAFQVFGTVAERMEQLTKLFSSGGIALQSFSKEFKDNGGAILGFQKGLGITDEQMGVLAQTAKATGTSVTDQLMDITKQADHLGKTFGVDVKIISKGMAKASTDISHFGSMSKAQIGAAVTYFSKLGVEVDKVTGAMDAFSTFDEAADKVSTLNQVMGTNVDAMKLTNAQDPAEVIEHLRQEFARAGIDGEKMNRQQRMMVKQLTNLDDAEQKLLFSSKNRGLSLAQVRKESEKAEKKTMTQTEAMSKLADSMDRVLKAGESKEGGFFGHFFQGFTDGLQRTQEFQELMRNIRGSLREVYFAGVRLGKAFIEFFPGVKDFLGGLSDIFKPEKFKKLANGVTDVFIGFFKDLESGKASFPDLMDRLKKKFFDFFDSEKGSGQKVLGGFKKIMMAIQVILAGGIKWIMESIGGFIRNIVDFIKNPQGVAGGAGGLADAASSYISPIGQAFRDGWKVLGPALGDLFSVLFDKLGEIIMPKVKAFAAEYWPILAGILFGPAAARALLGAGTAVLTKSIGGMISKAFGSKDTQTMILEEMKGLNKTLAAGASGGAKAAEAAGTAGKTIGAAAEQGPALQAASAVGTGINWAAIGTFLIGFAGVMAIGLLTFYIAAQIVEDMDKETVMKALAVTLAMAISAVPVALAMQILSKMPPPDAATLVMSLIALGATMIALAGIGFIVSNIAGTLDMSAIGKGLVLILGMSLAAVMVGAALWLIIPASAAVADGGIALALGLAALGIAMVGLTALGLIVAGIASTIEESSVKKGMMIVLGMSLAAVAVSLALAGIMAAGALVIFSAGGAAAAMEVGFVTLGAAIVGLGVLAGIIAVAASTVDINTVKKGGDVIFEAAKVVGIAALAVGAATLVGALLLLGGGMGAVAFLAGFAAIDLILGDEKEGLVHLSMKIAESVSQMPADLGPKAEAFTKIMDSVTKLAQVIPDALEEMDLGFFEDSSDQTTKINAVGTMIKDLMGSINPATGLIGIVNTIITGLGQMKPEQVEAAKAIGPVLQGVAGIAAAFTSVGSSMGEAFKNIDDDDFHKMPAIIQSMSGMIDKIAEHIPKVINGIIPIITAASGKDINVEGVKAVGSLMQAIGPIAQALSPPPGVMSTLTEMSKHWGSDEVAMMGKMTEYVDKIAGVLAGEEGKKGLLEVMKDQIVLIIQSMNGLNISESSGKALAAIGPILSTVIDFVKSMMDKGMEQLKDPKLQELTKDKKFADVLGDITKFAGDVLEKLSTHIPALVQGIAAGLVAASSLTPDQVKVLEPVGKLIESILKLVVALMPQPSWPPPPDPSKVAAGAIVITNITASFPKISDILGELKTHLPDLINTLVSTVENLPIKNFPLFRRNVDIVTKLFEIFPKFTELGKAMGMADKEAGTVQFSQEQGKKLAFALDGIAWGIKGITNEEYYHSIGGVGRTPMQFFIDELGPGNKIWTAAMYIDVERPKIFLQKIKAIVDLIKGFGSSATDMKSAQTEGLKLAAAAESVAMAIAYLISPAWYQSAGGTGRPPAVYLSEALKNEWPQTENVAVGIPRVTAFMANVTALQKTLAAFPVQVADFSAAQDQGKKLAAGVDAVAWGIGALIDGNLYKVLGGTADDAPLPAMLKYLDNSAWKESDKLDTMIVPLQKFLGNVKKVAGSFDDMSGKIKASTANTYGPVAKAIGDMMNAIATIDAAVSGVKKVNLKTTLDRFKANFGSVLGGSGSHVVQAKPFQMQVNFVVEIDAAKLEGAIVKHGVLIKDSMNLVMKAVGSLDDKKVLPDDPLAPLPQSGGDADPNDKKTHVKQGPLKTVKNDTTNGTKNYFNFGE